MDLPCHIHTKKDEEGNFIYPKHTTRQCRLLIQQFQGKQPKDKEKESDKAEDKEDSDGEYPLRLSSCGYDTVDPLHHYLPYLLPSWGSKILWASL